MRAVLAALIGAASLAACSSGELVSTTNVRMTVESHRSSSRRFWVTLVEQDGRRWERVRVGGKRCRRGVAALPTGSQITVSVERWRYPDGHVTDGICRADLRSRFC